MKRGKRATTIPLLIAVAFLLSSCVTGVDYGEPAYAYSEPTYSYPAYYSPLYFGWGGWHRGFQHGHFAGHRGVVHVAHGGFHHGFSGHGGGHHGGHR